jgi:uncharacterized membrane protein
MQRGSLLPTALIGAALLVIAVVFMASSSWYLAFESIHVVFVVIWVGAGTLLAFLGVVAERQNDPTQLATSVLQAAVVRRKLFSPAAVVVLAMGIAMMINGDLDWGKFWVSFGLLGFVASMILGMAVLGPMSRRLEGPIETGGPGSAEAQAAIGRILLISRIEVAVLLLVVVDMVVKPFS